MWAGLLRPKGQKFKVTAKGGDRSRRFLQWPLLRIYLLLMGFTVAGIVFAFVIDPSRPLAESSAVALFWSWYNILMLALACFVCIEQPRFRSSERFKVEERIAIGFDGVIHTYAARDFSTTGILFAGPPPAAIGQSVTVMLDGAAVPARVARMTPDGFAVALDASKHSRIAMTRRIFSGRYSTAIEAIHPLRVARAITDRLFR